MEGKDYFKCRHCKHKYWDSHCSEPDCWDLHRDYEGNLNCPYFEPDEETQRILTDYESK